MNTNAFLESNNVTNDQKIQRISNEDSPVQEFVDLLTTTWKGLTITTGLIAGIFKMFTEYGEITIEEMAKEYGYDQGKLDLWFYFAEKERLIEKNGQSYHLTSLGKCFTVLAPSKELYGFANLTEYYLEATLRSPEAFKKEKSTDNLSGGKISRDYQPKVSDNFSAVLLNYFKEYNVESGDSLLDIGCGNGSFLRKLAQAIPGMGLTGMEPNKHAVRKGIQENKEMGLSGNIKLVTGDAREGLNRFGDGSYDWTVAINLLHFYPVSKRQYLIDNMMRIAKKGVFINEGILENSPISSRANLLMSLLWNDFSGFFRPDELEDYNKYIQTKYKEYDIKIIPVIQGTSLLIVILKG